MLRYTSVYHLNPLLECKVCERRVLSVLWTAFPQHRKKYTEYGRHTIAICWTNSFTACLHAYDVAGTVEGDKCYKKNKAGERDRKFFKMSTEAGPGLWKVGRY